MSDDGGAIHLDEKTARGVRQRFENYAGALEGMRDDVKKVVRVLDDAAGECSALMEGGTGAFGASWQEAFDRASRSAAVTAENINNMSMDLKILDLHVP